MRYRTPEAFRAALDQRLKNEAATSGASLMRLRKRVAFERFLARLSAAGLRGWVLKGAFALDLRLGLRTRTTKDIDLARADDEEAATEHLIAAAALDLGDFFGFEVRRTPALDAAAGFHAVRYSVGAELAGRRFEQFPADVALGETSVVEHEHLRAPNSLAFAEIDAAELPVVALEQHVAEKLHAYTATYGNLERESSRVKDLVDLVLIADLAELEAERLRRALASTFSERARQRLPAALPPPPRSWATPYAEQGMSGSDSRVSGARFFTASPITTNWKKGVVQQGGILTAWLVTGPGQMLANRDDCVANVSQAVRLLPTHSGTASLSTSARMRSLSMSGVATSTGISRIS